MPSDSLSFDNPETYGYNSQMRIIPNNVTRLTCPQIGTPVKVKVDSGHFPTLLGKKGVVTDLYWNKHICLVSTTIKLGSGELTFVIDDLEPA